MGEEESGRPELNLKSLEKTGIVAVTEEQFNELKRIMECGGWRWFDGSRPTELVDWRKKWNEVCISAGAVKRGDGSYEHGRIRHGPKEAYLDNGDEIISVGEFYSMQDPPITESVLDGINEFYERRGEEKK